MKTMIAKYPGTCCECNKPIRVQTPIKFYGRGRAAHVNCYNPDGKTECEIASEQRAPCWICGDAQGKFRQLGAATPVWCDACHTAEMNKSKSYVRDPGEDQADRDCERLGL